MSDILKKDGLSLDILEKLSYQSQLGILLKKNLHYFDKAKVLSELNAICDWYDNCSELHVLSLDYRVKSIQSAKLKYERYYPNHQMRKVFNDILGFRLLCDNYDDVLQLEDIQHIRVADMSQGKAKDDGYRGVHVYYQLSGYHYPIEIQYNTYYDRQLNNWLHKYVYKHNTNAEIGLFLRNAYEDGKIRNEKDFVNVLHSKEVLQHVLSDCETI